MKTLKDNTQELLYTVEVCSDTTFSVVLLYILEQAPHLWTPFYILYIFLDASSKGWPT